MIEYDILDIMLRDDNSYTVTPPPAPGLHGLIEIYFDKVSNESNHTTAYKIRSSSWNDFYKILPSTVVIHKPEPDDTWMSFKDGQTINADTFIRGKYNLPFNHELEVAVYWKAQTESPWYNENMKHYILVIYKDSDQLNEHR